MKKNGKSLPFIFWLIPQSIENIFDCFLSFIIHRVPIAKIIILTILKAGFLQAVIVVHIYV